MTAISPSDSLIKTPIDLAILRVVLTIPRGRVATYGQVATLADLPRGHRRVARVLRLAGGDLPWFRVVGKRGPQHGYVSIPDPDGAQVQTIALQMEGVVFDGRGRICLRTHGWLPL